MPTPLDPTQLDDTTLAVLFHALLVMVDDIHTDPEDDVWERAEQLRTAVVDEMNHRRGYV